MAGDSRVDQTCEARVNVGGRQAIPVGEQEEWGRAGVEARAGQVAAQRGNRAEWSASRSNNNVRSFLLLVCLTRFEPEGGVSWSQGDTGAGHIPCPALRPPSLGEVYSDTRRSA